VGRPCQLASGCADAQRWSCEAGFARLQGSAKTLFHWLGFSSLTISFQRQRAFSAVLQLTSDFALFFALDHGFLSISKSSPRLRCEGHVEFAASTVPSLQRRFSAVGWRSRCPFPSLVRPFIKVDSGEHDVLFQGPCVGCHGRQKLLAV